MEKGWDDLLRAAQSGDAEAVNSLLSRLAVTLRTILQYRLRGWSREDREDLLQETLITFSQKLPGLKSNPHYYAAAILRNKIGDALRSRRGFRQVSLDAISDRHPPELQKEIYNLLEAQTADPDVQKQMEFQENHTLIQNALKRLSIFCQTFFLGVLEQRSAEELWRLFLQAEPGLKRGAFRKRIFDCRMRLKEILLEQE
jgi:RNA polymerase sigma factor (sigma-70 family)